MWGAWHTGLFSSGIPWNTGSCLEAVVWTGRLLWWGRASLLLQKGGNGLDWALCISRYSAGWCCSWWTSACTMASLSPTCSDQGRESRSSQFSGNQDAAAGGETPDLWFNKTLPPLADHRADETSYFNSTYLLLTSSINRAIHASLSDWYFPLFPVAFRATNEKTLFWLGLYYSCTKCGRTDLDNYKLEGSDWSWSNLVYLFPF